MATTSWLEMTFGPRPGRPLPGPRDVFGYFDNDIKSAAPLDALALMGLTGAVAYEMASAA